MNKFKIPLVMTTCLTAFLSHQAIAHSHKSSAKHHQAKSVGQTSSSSGKMLPQDVRKIDSSKKTASVQSPTPESEAIVVLGAGSSRETQSVSRTALMEYTPGTSPFKALSKLPGVMFTSSDPLGSYEWSQQIIIRGFDQSRLGFTMDGMPLGNLAYGNDNGLSIGRALQTENNGRATLSQGAGSVDVAASNDLGGALQFTSIDPTDKFGVDVAGTVGSASTWRTFMRVNTGKLPGGGKLYVSYDYQDANKWKGDGQQRQQQANAKFIQPLSENVKLTLFGDWSKRQENDYQDLSLATIGKYGYRVDNITGNYALAKEIASAYKNGTPYPAGIGSTNMVALPILFITTQRVFGRMHWAMVVSTSRSMIALRAMQWSMAIPTAVKALGLRLIRLHQQGWEVRRFPFGPQNMTSIVKVSWVG